MTAPIADHNYLKTLYGFIVIRRGQVRVKVLLYRLLYHGRPGTHCLYTGYFYSAFGG